MVWRKFVQLTAGRCFQKYCLRSPQTLNLDQGWKQHRRTALSFSFRRRANRSERKNDHRSGKESVLATE
jgi:hypothetical protein